MEWLEKLRQVYAKCLSKHGAQQVFNNIYKPCNTIRIQLTPLGQWTLLSKPQLCLSIPLTNPNHSHHPWMLWLKFPYTTDTQEKQLAAECLTPSPQKPTALETDLSSTEPSLADALVTGGKAHRTASACSLRFVSHKPATLSLPANCATRVGTTLSFHSLWRFIQNQPCRRCTKK